MLQTSKATGRRNGAFSLENNMLYAYGNLVVSGLAEYTVSLGNNFEKA